jgi:thioredoxin 2
MMRPAPREETMQTRLVRCPSCGVTNRVPLEKVEAGLRPVCGRCKAPMPVELRPVVVTDATFAAEVERWPLPVVVDLWAPWCGPCRMVSPVLEQLAKEKAGELKLVKVDIDRAPKLAQRFSVQAVPTLMVLHRGEVIARQPGAAPVDVLRRWVNEAVTRIPAESGPGGGS